VAHTPDPQRRTVAEPSRRRPPRPRAADPITILPSPDRARPGTPRLHEVLAEMRALAEAVERLSRIVEELPERQRAEMEELGRRIGRGVVAVARTLRDELARG
jgi:predicted transcriptional regulator